jgi:hypothetical protein
VSDQPNVQRLREQLHDRPVADVDRAMHLLLGAMQGFGQDLPADAVDVVAAHLSQLDRRRASPGE